MRTTGVDKSKCLICEVSCHQKGLAFFKFPEEESMLKMWIKEISPLLDILKVQPNSLKENGRICARHFREKDFVTCKQNSLVHNACPSLSVSNLSFNYQKKGEGSEEGEEGMSGDEQSNDGSEKDIFQCGRCKSEFEVLSEFLQHKKFNCQSNNNKKVTRCTAEKKAPVAQFDLLSVGNTLTNNFNIELRESQEQETFDPSCEQVVKIISQDSLPDNRIVSLVVNENGLVVGNSVNISTLPSQIMLTPQLPLCYNGVIIGNHVDHSLAAQVIVTSQVPVDGSVSSQQTPSLTFPERGDKEEVEKLRQLGENELEKLKTKLPCPYCGKVFEKPFNLQQHERVHTGERPFQCIICGRAFTQKSNVRKHMMRHKVWPKGKQTLKLRRNQGKGVTNGELFNEVDYSCQYCTLSFKSYAEHKRHLSVHSNFKVYRCIQKGCNETFNDLDEFLTHSRAHSSAEFQCHICLKIFTNLEELGVHQYDHDTTGKKTDIKLKCNVCHARFKTAESLKNHLAVDTHNYECTHCKSVFCSERFLRRHLFTHADSSQSKFKCPNCKKSFRTQQNLKNHTFIHLKEKPFTCEHCHKQFASKYRLKRHVAIHLNQYLECPFKKHLGCDKTFYRKDKLREHVSTHSRCRLRSCRVCSKMYWTLSKLHQHMRKEHKSGTRGSREGPKCGGCSQTFRKQKQLSQHHCTVEGRRRGHSDEVGKEGLSETVSNIEIIMVPFSSSEHNSA